MMRKYRMRAPSHQKHSACDEDRIRMRTPNPQLHPEGGGCEPGGLKVKPHDEDLKKYRVSLKQTTTI